MNPEIPSSKLSAEWRRWLLALLLWIMVASVAALALWMLHRTAMKGQGREMDLLTLAVADEIDRGLSGVEEGLQALRLELGQHRLPRAGDDTAKALKMRADLMPLVTTLWLLGPDGALVAASDATPPPDLESFLPRLASLAPGQIALSRPFVEPLRQVPMVAFAFRVEAAGSAPGSWIVGDIPAADLLGAFAVASPGVDARMSIFRSDGVRLAGAGADGAPPDASGVARPVTGQPNLEVLRFRYGKDRLADTRQVAPYGLQVQLSRDLDAVLADWRGAAELSAGALAVLMAIMAAAVQAVSRAERRRLAAQQALQSQLSRASKLEALGALAGGVAHDFNNVLAGIVGYGEMAQEDAPAGSDQARYLDKVLQAAARGKGLIERILAFSRGGARESTVFELEPLVEEVLSLMAASLRSGVVLERALEAPGARLRGDATQAFEAVMNLCTNAMQAMPEGGMLSVQLRRQSIESPRVLSHTALPAGRYLSLSVADQGMGIEPAVMERLFEPFFTTRAAQAGTGLGLAVVFGVVAEFGGGIDVQSRPGQGSCFTLYLPESRDSVAAPADSPASAPRGSGQRLLVLDDEPALVALAEEMLQGLGYEAVGFGDAGAALQALLEAPGRFDALLTDEVMPGLTGTQLTQALRERGLDLPVLLVSGYGGASLARRAAAAGVTRVLTKPLKRADLARALAGHVR